VLIYFDNTSKTRVVEKLARHLASQGLLFIGHAENLHSITQGLKSVAPTVYLQNKEKHTSREVR
jgi:chemotaxis protein methyltransferase CheR